MRKKATSIRSPPSSEQEEIRNMLFLTLSQKQKQTQSFTHDLNYQNCPLEVKKVH